MIKTQNVCLVLTLLIKRVHWNRTQKSCERRCFQYFCSKHSALGLRCFARDLENKFDTLYVQNYFTAGSNVDKIN